MHQSVISTPAIFTYPTIAPFQIVNHTFPWAELAFDFFIGLRSFSKEMLIRLEKRIENVIKSQEILNTLIHEIENLESLNKKKIRKIVKELINVDKEDI